MKPQVVAIIFLILSIDLVKGDLPVHCLKNQIVGEWAVQLSKVETQSQEKMVTCGHQQPDNESTSWKAMKDEFESQQQFNIRLHDDDTVQGSIDGQNYDGTWTMIYDEGFEIQLSQYKFFSFSKYVSSGMDFESVCDQTLVGWYNNLQTGEKGCYKGFKPNSNGQVTQNVKQDKVVQPKAEEQKEQSLETADNASQSNTNEFLSTSYDSFTIEPEYMNNQYEDQNDFAYEGLLMMSQVKKEHKQEKHVSTHLKHQQKHHRHIRRSHKNSKENDDEDNLVLHKQFSDHQQVVDKLNKIEKSWTAKVPEEFKEFNISEMNKRAGRIRRKQKSSPFTFTSFAQTNKNANQNDSYQSFSREDLSDLPKEFSWEEYINEPVQQRDCGSCYAIATSEMLSTRLKIHHKEDVRISAQHSLDCNFYNQGCDGGYGFLVSKFASEYEMVREECHPYKAVNGRCADSCDVSKEKKTYKVSDYKYLGGAYGKSSERVMMEEMMENGPIVVSFEPAYDFMYYDSGIYHSVDAEKWIKNHDSQPVWEKVDHSVLAYGWGEEEGQKYWKVLNSWGSNWGENGTFRIRRGTDESHIESMGEAATPIVINKY